MRKTDQSIVATPTITVPLEPFPGSPGGPAFYELFRSLRSELRGIEARVELMETKLESLDERLEKLEPVEITPPETPVSEPAQLLVDIEEIPDTASQIKPRSKGKELMRPSSYLLTELGLPAVTQPTGTEPPAVPAKIPIEAQPSLLDMAPRPCDSGCVAFKPPATPDVIRLFDPSVELMGTPHPTEHADVHSFIDSIMTHVTTYSGTIRVIPACLRGRAVQWYWGTLTEQERRDMDTDESGELWCRLLKKRFARNRRDVLEALLQMRYTTKDAANRRSIKAFGAKIHQLVRAAGFDNDHSIEATTFIYEAIEPAIRINLRSPKEDEPCAEYIRYLGGCEPCLQEVWRSRLTPEVQSRGSSAKPVGDMNGRAERGPSIRTSAAPRLDQMPRVTFFDPEPDRASSSKSVPTSRRESERRPRSYAEAERVDEANSQHWLDGDANDDSRHMPNAGPSSTSNTAALYSFDSRPSNQRQWWSREVEEGPTDNPERSQRSLLPRVPSPPPVTFRRGPMFATTAVAGPSAPPHKTQISLNDHLGPPTRSQPALHKMQSVPVLSSRGNARFHENEGPHLRNTPSLAARMNPYRRSFEAPPDNAKTAKPLHARVDDDDEETNGGYSGWRYDFRG